MLIDTHVLIWMFEAKLAKLGTRALVSLENQRFTVSAVSLMEIADKKRRKKLDAPRTAEIIASLVAKNIDIISIQPQHIADIPSLETMPHADPFDLLLVAQAVSEGLPLLTCDTKILDITYPGLRLIDGRK
jgi:PIN domain nuclease of toxin-antitoxin system